MQIQRTPDAECVDCGLGFATGHPSMGNLLRWECTSCGGKLAVHTRCGSCHRPIDRKTGIREVFGRLASPNKCEHCGEKVGLSNDLPGGFGTRDYVFTVNSRSILKHTPHRLRLAFVVLFYCTITAFVGATAGMMVGGCLVGGLYAGSVPAPEMLLGRSLLPGMAPLDTGGFYALLTLTLTAVFTVAGAWYGWRNVDTEVSKKEPTPLQ